MALLMLENNIPIHSVVAFDTGWEFPQMYEHWKLFEKKTGLKVEVLKPEKPLSYFMFEYPVVANKGPDKGRVHRIGYGWPSVKRRWCTRIKTKHMQTYQRTIEHGISCIGIAWDEQQRVKNNSDKSKRYPLVEWRITEKQALKICHNYGFDWDGLYDVFDRVSCFCCPLQRLNSLRLLRRYYPTQWNQMLEWETMIPTGDKGFMDKSVHTFDRRFACEDRQMKLDETINMERELNGQAVV